jgi:signal transduction histidine kinase
MIAALTLERRVTLWSALVVALSLVSCGGGGAWFLYHQEVGQLDRSLRQIAGQFFEQKRLHGGTNFDLRNQHELAEWLPPPGAQTVVEIEQGGAVYFRSPRLGELRLGWDRDDCRFVDLPFGRMRAAVFREDGITLRVAVPVQPLDELGRNLLIVFALGLPAVAAFVVLGGRAIARQALAPVRRIADSAEQITSQQLDRRVPVPEPGDEIRRLALVLNSTLDRLENSFRQAQHFSADASHELKTPLTALHAELESLLASPTLADVDRTAVAEALEKAKRLGAIIKSLLLLARADAGRLNLDLQPLDFVPIVRDCLEDVEIAAEASGLTVAAALPEAAVVRGEATRLRQILGNLMHNAVKYNRPGGSIRLSVTAADGRVILEVANTGPGIAPEQAPYVFDRFFRAQHHARIEGHGLGLAISRELARAHAGILELVRSNDSETVFRLTLPLAAGSGGGEPGKSKP